MLGFAIWYCPCTVSSLLTFLSSCGGSPHCHQVQQKIKPMSQCQLFNLRECQENNPDRHFPAASLPQRPPRGQADSHATYFFKRSNLRATHSPLKLLVFSPGNSGPEKPQVAFPTAGWTYSKQRDGSVLIFWESLSVFRLQNIQIATTN